MATTNAGMVLIERLAAEDMDVGIGPVQRSMPSSGTQQGHQINLSSLGFFKTALWAPASPVGLGLTVTTLTVSGARVGDAVIVTFDSVTFAQESRLTIEGRVSSANTVTIILRNQDPTVQINPGSGTLRVAVLPLPVAEG